MVATVGSISIDLSTNVGKFAAGFRSAATTVDRESGRMARSIKTAENATVAFIRASAGGLAGGVAAREVVRFADAWTEAGNKIAAAGVVAGREGRSLSELNDIANDTRSGISETVDLYAKLLRATGDVAKSEQEVATATEIVNKAFKAGGAAASEQAAGILQLSQALGSGLLQGDELRSIRENAPLLAKAIADEFGVTIGELKELGAEGVITSERVFKAILSAQADIDKAFASTQATTAEGFVALRNAAVELVGTLDSSTGASAALTEGMAALAARVRETASAVKELRDDESLESFQSLIGNLLQYDFITPQAIIRRFKDDVSGIGELFSDEALETAQSTAEMEAAIESLQAKIFELITAPEPDLLNAQKFADDVDFMKRKLAELQSAANSQRAALAQQFRAAENASMAALLPPMRSSSNVDERSGVGVTRFGTEEITESVDRVHNSIEDLDSGIGRHFEELGNSFDNTFDSVNDLLERGYQVIYDSIADGVRTGIVSGIQEGRGERQQYTVSTGPKDMGASQFGQMKNYSYAGAFADGGSFIAPGNQSGDTTRMLMDVNGGERVTVEPAGSTRPIVLNYHAAPGESERTARQNARIMHETLQRETARA